ncbi:alpha/beta hydrolase [Candidatus Pseudoscillospira sp. SGI.172]|uniref:alpha/beta hydrolase n=1 Tax=Candidatus Pseudoscillospira sp. SGI.172 TaxID=3420582 RepID=UPI003CFF863E
MLPDISFTRGTYQLNQDPNFNFQLNRVIQWDGGRLEDIAPVSAGIHSSADWKKTLIFLGDEAEQEGRTENAIAYYRMSEFFMYDGDPDKLAYYQKATAMFYDYYRDYFESGMVERITVPYEDVELPILHTEPDGPRRGVILLHGGNDSYLEEFFFPMLYLAKQGYAVYLFEGPGQGGVVRVQGKRFTYQWEKPVKAVLDAIGETNVTIMGASLGGMLAPRAAAFERSRICRVVGWSVFPNFLYVALYAVPKSMWGVMRWMIRHNVRGPINTIMKKKMASEPTVDWAVRHGMYAYDASDPFGYIKKLDDFKMTDIGPRLTQDMLVIGASHDHFIAKELYAAELDALPNVRSLTYRLMTEKEDAGAHCNVGNPKLVLDTVIDWLGGLERRDAGGEGLC